MFNEREQRRAAGDDFCSVVVGDETASFLEGGRFN